MNAEQEIRAKALEIIINYVGSMAIAKQSMSINIFDAAEVYASYIETGKKPEAPK